MRERESTVQAALLRRRVHGHQQFGIAVFAVNDERFFSFFSLPANPER